MHERQITRFFLSHPEGSSVNSAIFHYILYKRTSKLCFNFSSIPRDDSDIP